MRFCGVRAMNDMNIKNVLSVPFEKIGSEKPISYDPISDFKKALSQSVDDLNKQLLQADQNTQEMVLGEKDIHQAMIALEQANISLRMIIQIRNKIIAAYEEIMRMQF
jgi:flagellar hook-basal body complex protein FliE